MKPAFDVLFDTVKNLKISQQDKQLLESQIRDAKATRILNRCTIEMISNPIKQPVDVQKYDIVSTLVGGSAHPAIVYRVTEDKVYVIAFTSNANYLGNICQVVKSRLINDSYCTCTLQVLTMEEAKQHWKAIYDNRTEANMFFREFKNFYKQFLKLK